MYRVDQWRYAAGVTKEEDTVLVGVRSPEARTQQGGQFRSESCQEFLIWKRVR